MKANRKYEAIKEVIDSGDWIIASRVKVVGKSVEDAVAFVSNSSKDLYLKWLNGKEELVTQEEGLKQYLAVTDGDDWINTHV